MIQQKKDLELIIKIKDGDKKAEIKIYNYYKKRISWFIKKRYPQDNYIEDNVSEILIKVFENINNYSEGKSQFSTWVLSIAKNHMIDSAKKQQLIYTDFATNRSENLNFNSTASIFCNNINYSTYNNINYFTFNSTEPISFTSSPDHSLEIEDSINFISNNSTCVDFSMMIMKYMDGYSYNEIGKEFNISSSKASNKVNYAKMKIKKKNNK